MESTTRILAPHPAMVLVVMCVLSIEAAIIPTERYPHTVVLLPNDAYQLFWKYNDTTITFEVHAQTKGWVGFGLSSNGGMANSDIVIGWVKDGVANFHVRKRNYFFNYY